MTAPFRAMRSVRGPTCVVPQGGKIEARPMRGAPSQKRRAPLCVVYHCATHTHTSAGKSPLPHRAGQGGALPRRMAAAAASSRKDITDTAPPEAPWSEPPLLQKLFLKVVAWTTDEDASRNSAPASGELRPGPALRRPRRAPRAARGVLRQCSASAPPPPHRPDCRIDAVACTWIRR